MRQKFFNADFRVLECTLLGEPFELRPGLPDCGSRCRFFVLVLVIEEIRPDYAIRMMLADVSGPRTSMMWLCLSIWSIPDVKEDRISNLCAIVSLDYEHDTPAGSV